jgi:hypothetical protein
MTGSRPVGHELDGGDLVGDVRYTGADLRERQCFHRLEQVYD